MTPETVLQISIVSALSLYAARYNFLFFHVPNESFSLGAAGRGAFSSRDHARLTTLKKMGLLPGVSDLVILSRGRAYCLEVKTQTGSQSDAQKLFERRCHETGIPYAVVRSVDEAIKKLKEWEVIGK